jgi:hypothetical protein
MKSKLSSIPIVFAALLGVSSASVRAQTSCVVPPSGLAAWWRAEGNAKDSAGTNHGTLLNGILFASGRAGSAFSLDGNDDIVQVADSESLRPTAGVTLEAWIHTAGTADFSGIISKMQHSGTVHIGFKMDMDAGGRARADFGSGSGIGNDYISVTHTAIVTDGNWHHLVATYDGANGRFYVDGTSGPPENGTGFLTASSRTLIIGNDDCCPGRFFHGEIDEASVYNRALTAAEVQALFSAGSAGKCSAPVLQAVRAGAGAATISWAPDSPGFVLQESAGLATPAWNNSPSGGTNPITVPASLPAKFYRLTKP